MPLSWWEQVHGIPISLEIGGGAVIVSPASRALRFAPLASVPVGGVWPSADGGHDAGLAGGWISGAPYVSPVNPYSFLTDDQGSGAWVDINHDDSLDFPDGVTVWLDLVVHAIAARSIIFTTGSTAGAGEPGSFSLEVQPPANGSLIRAWVIDAAGVVTYFGGSASLSSGIAGSAITPGVPFSLALTMGPDGAAVAVDGVTLATVATTLTWRAAAKRFGAWIDGGAQINATLGGIRFSGALSPAQVAMIQASMADWRARLT